MEHLKTTGSTLIDNCKVENSKVKAQKQLVEMRKSWDDLMKSIDNKEKQMLTRKSKFDQFTGTFTKFSNQLDVVQQQVKEPVDWSAGDEMMDKAEVIVE